MYYTFRQAKEKLARFADGGVCGVGEAINDAVERLAATESWRCMERIVRVYAVDQVLPLPQNVAAILRATVAGTPSHIWGTDYQFISSGVGDLDYREGGLGLTDAGAGHCVMFDIPVNESAYLFAISDYPGDRGKVMALRVLVPDGTERNLEIPIGSWQGGVVGQINGHDLRRTTIACVKVDKVVLPDGLEGYVSLYAQMSDDAADIRFLGKYHPHITVPDFRRYRINHAMDAGVPLDILAQVRLNFVPLVDDNDVIPFDSLFAVQAMVQSQKEFNAGNIDQAMKYQALAVSLMEAKQQTQTRSQGLVVENALYDMSPGSMSGTFENL